AASTAAPPRAPRCPCGARGRPPPSPRAAGRGRRARCRRARCSSRGSPSCRAPRQDGTPSPSGTRRRPWREALCTRPQLLFWPEDGPDPLENALRAVLVRAADVGPLLLAQPLLRRLRPRGEDVAHGLRDRGVLLEEHAEAVAVQGEQL